MRTPTCCGSLLALVALLAAWGCRAAGPAPADRPADFAMSILVQPAEGDPEPMDAPRWARPAFYVLEPDGTLRAEFGPGVTGERLPVIARHLEPAQADRIYGTARSANLLEPDAQGRVRTPLELSEDHDLPEARVVVTLDGRTRYLAIPLYPDDAAGARPVIDELAELTWQH